MTDLPDFSAVDLLAAYRARTLSPVEVTQAVLDRIAAWEPVLNATWALDADGAMAAAVCGGGALDGACAGRRAGRRADHHQGEHRHAGHAGADGHGGHRAGACGSRCAGRGTRAGGRRGDPRQDHHARLRHAVLRPVQLPQACAQSLEHRAEPRRLVGRRRGGGGGGLWAIACRHRYRRFRATAGRLVRLGWAETQLRPRARRSTLYRPRGRTDDAQRGRCGAADERDRAARRTRPHESAARRHRLGRTGARHQWPAHRADAGPRHRPAGGAAGAGRRGRPPRVRSSRPAPSWSRWTGS